MFHNNHRLINVNKGQFNTCILYTLGIVNKIAIRSEMKVFVRCSVLCSLHR